jgi:hypothetical protein
MQNIIKNQVAQATMNTDVVVSIPTLLTVDGRLGWNIKRFKTTITMPSSIISTADATITVQLNTETGLQSFIDPDNVAQSLYLFNGIAASTSGYQIAPHQEWISDAGRLTVEPNLFLVLSTTGLTGVMIVYTEIEYETVKLTDMEVMRLLQGGA